jgi:hypothetical protein
VGNEVPSQPILDWRTNTTTETPLRSRRIREREKKQGGSKYPPRNERFGLADSRRRETKLQAGPSVTAGAPVPTKEAPDGAGRVRGRSGGDGGCRRRRRWADLDRGGARAGWCAATGLQKFGGEEIAVPRTRSTVGLWAPLKGLIHQKNLLTEN